jgi:hypothetical protein
MNTKDINTDRAVSAVLPLRGIWRAGLLAAWDFQALDKAGIKELADLAQWSRMDLLRLPGMDHAAVARIETLLARYGLNLAPVRRSRSRRPGR